MKDIFDDATIRNLPTKESDYTVIRRGLGVRVYPSGVRNFFYQYTIDGKRWTSDIGTYGTGPGKWSLKAVHRQYEKEVAMVNAVKRGDHGALHPAEVRNLAKAGREEIHKAYTMEDLIDEYVKKWAKKKKTARSAYNDERALRVDVLPRWKGVKAKDIRRSDAIALLEDVAERAPGQALYLAKVCRKMFSIGIEREIVETNPFVEAAKAIPELAARKRERTLSADEIRTIWTGIDEGAGSDAGKAILKLILVTAQRPSEVSGIRRSEIEGNWWTIPSSRTKNRKSHRVYLTDTALSLLPNGDGDLYFPSPRSEVPKAFDVGTFSYILKRSEHYGIPHWTPHDLRRTARTFFAEAGINREHAEAVLNHSLPGVEGTYNRYHYQKEKQLAMETWERTLVNILAEKQSTGKVIPITRAGL